jgi:hypothetical protein
VRGLNRLPSTRIVASPSALDSATWPKDSIALRIAADEVFVIPPVDAPEVNDPHAIIVPDASLAGAWLPMDVALDLLERHCEWELPHERPAFAQGMIAGIAAKLWFENERVLVIVPAPFITEFEERTA